MERQRGFSLGEILIGLTILMLICTLGLSSLQHILMHGRANEASARINTSVRQARQLALQTHQIVSVCGSADHQTCNGNWSDNLIIFIDDTASANMAARIVSSTPEIDHGQTSWEAFRSTKKLSFYRNGVTLGYNGTFIYCPKNKDPHYGRGLVVNKSGRIRALKDTDNDGIVNRTPQANITCP